MLTPSDNSSLMERACNIVLNSSQFGGAALVTRSNKLLQSVTANDSGSCWARTWQMQMKEEALSVLLQVSFNCSLGSTSNPSRVSARIADLKLTTLPLSRLLMWIQQLFGSSWIPTTED